MFDHERHMSFPGITVPRELAAMMANQDRPEKQFARKQAPRERAHESGQGTGPVSATMVSRPDRARTDGGT
jgi:hypothetical protein